MGGKRSRSQEESSGRMSDEDLEEEEEETGGSDQAFVRDERVCVLPRQTG